MRKRFRVAVFVLSTIASATILLATVVLLTNASAQAPQSSKVANATLNLTTSSTSSATAISIDFVGLYTTPMASSEVAGVVPLSNWNNAPGASSSFPLALLDQNGNSTSATVTWKSDNVWESSSVPDQPGNDRMMRGYLDNGKMDTTTVTVSGLPPNANGYNVYVYAEDLSTATKTGIYQISGPGITTTSIIIQFETSFNGTFTQATSSNPVGNYAILTIPSVSAFTLSAIPNTASIPYHRAPVQGMQIVPLGPPNPDFTISASPASQSVDAGNSTTYTATLSALNGFSGTVNLTAGGLPSGTTASFSPSWISGSGDSILTVSTAAGSAASSSSTLSITGTSGTLMHSATVTLNVTTAGSSTNVISIDFVGLGTAMGSAEQAGVLPKTNWNNATGAVSSAPLALVDETGTSTNVTVSWRADNIWDELIVDQPGNVRMMRGYLDNGHQDTTIVTVNGLPSDPNGFKIYVYADGSNSGSGSNTGIYQVSGPGITTSNVTLTYNSNFNGTFTQATTSSSVGNYLILTIPNVSGFTLSAIPSFATSGYKRAPVNGIQIVPQ